MQHIKLSQSSSFMTLGAWDTAWMLSKFWPMTKGSSLHYSAWGQLQQQCRDCACILVFAASGLMAHYLDSVLFQLTVSAWSALFWGLNLDKWLCRPCPVTETGLRAGQCRIHPVACNLPQCRDWLADLVFAMLPQSLAYHSGSVTSALSLSVLD